MTTTIGSLDLNAFNDLYSDSNQYFWFEGNGSATYGAGAHVTLVPDTTFISNPTGQNILMNTDGFSIRNGLLPMMTLDNNSLDFNVVDTTAGTYTITATFTATGAQIGQSNKTHVNVYSNSLELTDSAGTTFFKVRDAVNESGEVTNTFVGDGNTTQFTLSYTASNTTYTVTQNGTTVSPTKTTTQITFSIAPAVGDIIVVVYNIVGNSAKAYDLGIRKTNTISGSYSVIEGYATTASGVSSHAEGRNTTASGSYSHAEGYLTTASGYYSHAEGDGTSANGSTSHAEGAATTANGSASHAEGYVTTASGEFSHSEGINTSASGYASHAEGRDTTASEYYSHAAGWGTIAVGVGQTAIGKYNIQDPDVQTSKEKAFIIGNGSSSVRSNAFTVDWNGNVNIPSGASYHVNDTPIADFIIEQGTDNNWVYRKWNSGIYEAWLRFNATGMNLTTVSSNTYYSATSGVKNVSLPSFNVGTDYYITGQEQPSMSSSVYIYSIQTYTAGMMQISYRAHASTSNAQCNGMFYLMGKWK